MKASRLAYPFVVACLAFPFGVGARAAPEPSGVALAVIQSTEIDGATGKQVLQPEAAVYAGDRIITGEVGEAQIRFRDNTKLVVGPNSSMVIDAFVFNDDNSAREISINLARGTFRFFTGLGRKDAYSISTPTATIGVRGSEFDVTVDPIDLSTYVAQIGGETRICQRRRNESVEDSKKRRDCSIALPGCSIFVVAAGKNPRELKATADRNLAVKNRFRYVRNQRSLLAGFRLSVSACGAFAEGSSLQTLGALATVPALAVLPAILPVSP